MFANSRPSASNFNSFSQSLQQFFLTVGQKNFGNKIPFSNCFNLISDEKKTSPKEINIQTATDGGQDKAVPQDVFNYLSTLEANLTTRYACSYCGDRFSKRHYRDTHEKDNHVDKDGKFTELTCDLCQEKLPTPEQYRRYSNFAKVKFFGQCSDQ